MSGENAATNAQPGTQEKPANRRGAHKPDCPCGWCEQRRRNLAKKKEGAQVKPAQEPASVSAKESGSDSAPSSAQKSSSPAQPSMATKVKTMESEKTASATSKGEHATQQPKSEPGWFEKVFGFGDVEDFLKS